MRLRSLIRHAYPELGAVAAALPDSVVSGVTQNATQVVPGTVFVARTGQRFDGHRFVTQAVASGAVLVAGARAVPPLSDLAGVPYLQVPDDRAAPARLAAAFHGAPSRRTRVIGVTGTDGKTTTSALLWWLLQGLAPTALASTAMVRIGLAPSAPVGHFTTPEADEVQAFLASAVDGEATRVVLESSSHGLAQNRLDEIDYAAAVWTNLSPEHLDFHRSFDAYREAKLSLVRRAPVAVVNRDDVEYEHFSAAARERVSYGMDARADWRLLQVAELPGALRLDVGAPDGRSYAAHLPLPGRYNASNALAAWATATLEGSDVAAAGERLATFPGVPGRMQTIQAEPFAVVVDFAHTPSALAKALAAAVPPGGRRIVVIGAAGERDPGKRAPLGAAAVAGAELAIFSEEDSRSEDTAEILAAMATGARDAGGVEGDSFVRIPDRREAIHHAIRTAGTGDLVLLCGKGHETTLERAGETLAWDEAAEARAALSTLQGE